VIDVKAQLQRVRALVFRRKCYRDVLCDPRGTLTPAAQLMLADLARYCKYSNPGVVNGPTGVDVPATMFTMGMQALLKRMLLHARLDDSELAAAERALQQSQTKVIQS